MKCGFDWELYVVVTYVNMRGVRAVDRIVDLCQRDLAFILLTKGQQPKRDAFYDFKGKKLKGGVLDELNCQFLRRLEKEGFITLKQLYIDGTKIETNANRYTFVWCGTLNYHLAAAPFELPANSQFFLLCSVEHNRNYALYQIMFCSAA